MKWRETWDLTSIPAAEGAGLRAAGGATVKTLNQTEPFRRRILRQRRSSDRKNEMAFVVIEIEVRAGRISICGFCGYAMGRRDAAREERAGSFPGGPEVYMRRLRRVYFLEGCGQITREILDFFPEMRPHMDRHLERLEEADWSWLKRRFRRSHEADSGWVFA